MKATTQVFVFIITLGLCEAAKTADLPPRAPVIRKVAVEVESTGLIHQHSSEEAPEEEEKPVEPVEKTVEAVEAAAPAEAPKEEEKPVSASAENHEATIKGNHEETIKGKLEQTNASGVPLCLGVHKHTDGTPTTSGEHELEMVSCFSSSDLDDEEWEADSAIIHHSHHSHYTPHQIRLAASADDHCLEADHHHLHVHLKRCSKSDSDRHHRQLWVHDDETNEFRMAVRTHHSHAVNESTVHKCLTTHHHPADAIKPAHVTLVLQECGPVFAPPAQEWKFNQAKWGELKQGEICLDGHLDSDGSRDLESVGCKTEDSNDDDVWELDATDSAPQHIKTQTKEEVLCLTADHTYHSVDLKSCHASSDHLQMWTYNHYEKTIKIDKIPDTTEPEPEHKCLTSEGKKEDGHWDDLVLTDCIVGDPLQKWEFLPGLLNVNR